MSDDVSRVHGPSSDGPRYRWKPRLSSSDAVRHSSTTEASPGTAANDCSFTAVATGGPNTKFAFVVTSPQYWKSRMSVVIRLSTGLVV